MDIEITKHCPLCGTEQIVTVDSSELEAYDDGLLIQDAFPSLTPNEREVIKTGICAPCWDSALGEE